MSNMVLVSVFDHAVGEYAPCMCVNSEAAAIRIFTNEVNRYDPNNLLSTNKSDFSRYNRAMLNVEDSSPERLAVREEVTNARISSLSRKL